jgi:NitT/TauT family transport system ATP-binding protein
MRLLQEARDHRMHKDVVEEELAIRLTTEDIDRLFHTIITWGRFGELFGFDSDSQILYLDPDAQNIAESETTAGKSQV